MYELVDTLGVTIKCFKYNPIVVQELEILLWVDLASGVGLSGLCQGHSAFCPSLSRPEGAMVSVSEQMSQKIHKISQDMGPSCPGRERKLFYKRFRSLPGRELIVASLLRVIWWWWGGGKNMEGEKVDTSLKSVVKPFKAGIIIGKVFWLWFSYVYCIISKSLSVWRSEHMV